MRDLYITANSPGEIAGWLKPLVINVKKSRPDFKITVILLPCNFASGGESDVVSAIPGVDEIITSKEFFRHMVKKTFKKDSSLFHLGGDLMYPAMISRRFNMDSYAYLWAQKKWDKHIKGYFVRGERDLNTLLGRGIRPDKIFMVGDFLVDSVYSSFGENFIPPAINEISKDSPVKISFLPGSRVKEVYYLVPFYLGVAEIIKEKYPDARFNLLLSPFLKEKDMAKALSANEDAKLGSISGEYLEAEALVKSYKGTCLNIYRKDHLKAMADSDLVITIPGTKTGEAGALGRPMLVILPLNKPELITYTGIAGILDWIPVLGAQLKKPVIMWISKRIGYFSLPNILSGKKIVPEIKGIIKPADVASAAVALLENPAERKRMSKDLLELYSVHRGAVDRALNIIFGEKK